MIVDTDPALMVNRSDSLMIYNIDDQLTAAGSSHPVFYFDVGSLTANQSSVEWTTMATTTPPKCVNDTPPVQLDSSSSVFIAYRIIVDVYLVGVLCTFGFIGNFLSIAVLCRDREKQNTTNWLLQTLAVVDSFFLAFSLLIQPVKTVHDVTDWWPDLRKAFPYIEPHLWALASIAQTMAVWLVMLITIDRYVAVCKPWHTKWRALRRVKLTVFVMFLLAVLYNVPRFLERKMVLKHSCRGGGFVVRTEKTAFRDNRNYFLAYKTVCYFIFRSIGPLVILIALNARLVRALQLVRLKHRDMTKRTKQRENITVMLVAVVTVFIICQLPDLGLRIAVTAKEFSPLVHIDLQSMRYANAASNALLTVNSSINFLIYCLIGKKFRRIFVHMATCSNERTRGSNGAAAAGGRADTRLCGAVTSGTCRLKDLGSIGGADVSETDVMLTTTHLTTMGHHRLSHGASSSHRLTVLLKTTTTTNARGKDASSAVPPTFIL